MKKFLASLITLVFCTLALQANAQLNDPNAGDLVPWPWGTECVFPWNEIEGNWRVRGTSESIFNSHKLGFEIAEDVRGGVKLLYIKHMNERGEPIGHGTGYGDKDNKLIKAIMTIAGSPGLNYEIIVRAYSRDDTQTVQCVGGKMALAVTFCPRDGKRCLENSSYLLEK